MKWILLTSLLKYKKHKNLTYRTYELTGMKRIMRMDYIVNNDGIPFLIEINSVPGMSKESIVPQMVNVSNLVLSLILL